MKYLFKKTFNPLSHRKYTGLGGKYTRKTGIALICWYDWEIKPLFTGEMYKPDGTKYCNRKYYWKRLLRK